jgi:hypothetical protein
VVRLDLRDWVPEAEELTRPAEALRRSGLVPLLRHAGLPLRPVPPSGLAEAVRAAPPQLLPLTGMPLPYTVLRSLAIVVAAGALIWAVVGRPPGMVWPVAGAALSSRARCGWPSDSA